MSHHAHGAVYHVYYLFTLLAWKCTRVKSQLLLLLLSQEDLIKLFPYLNRSKVGYGIKTDFIKYHPLSWIHNIITAGWLNWVAFPPY